MYKDTIKIMYFKSFLYSINLETFLNLLIGVRII
jgi:hypothetical protein